jgi:hypothetical protein
VAPARRGAPRARRPSRGRARRCAPAPDAIDFAFEYLEAQRPARLLVFRTYGKKREEVWAYDEQEADHAATPQELVDVFGFDVVRWRGPSS